MNPQQGIAADTYARRSAVVDMAKGIGIILVVYGRCLRELVAASAVAAAVLIPIQIQLLAMRERLNEWVGLPSSVKAAGRSHSA